MKRLLLTAIFVTAASVGLFAQSTDPANPAPITSRELSAAIKARDIGDARQTTYYYAFEGTQGDIFINVVSRNFTGDIDVFLETGMRPLTKIVFYGDSDATETGRLIYLRKPERLILRLQGRTPGDDAASITIKFAGSFVALAPLQADKEPTIEGRSTDSEVIVNSVGTIIGARPKAKPTPSPTATDRAVAEVSSTEVKPAKPIVKQPVKTEAARKKPVVVVDDYPGISDTTSKRETKSSKPPAKPTRKPPTRTERTSTAKAAEPERKTPAVDPLAGVRLVVNLKDGNVVEKMLTDLVRFTFDKGVLTIIGKDGSIVRYPMTDVASVNVQ